MKILEPFFMHYFDVFILHEKLKLYINTIERHCYIRFAYRISVHP